MHLEAEAGTHGPPDNPNRSNQDDLGRRRAFISKAITRWSRTDSRRHPEHLHCDSFACSRKGHCHQAEAVGSRSCTHVRPSARLVGIAWHHIHLGNLVLSSTSHALALHASSDESASGIRSPALPRGIAPLSGRREREHQRGPIRRSRRAPGLRTPNNPSACFRTCASTDGGSPTQPLPAPSSTLRSGNFSRRRHRLLTMVFPPRKPANGPTLARHTPTATPGPGRSPRATSRRHPRSRLCCRPSRE